MACRVCWAPYKAADPAQPLNLSIPWLNSLVEKNFNIGIRKSYVGNGKGVGWFKDEGFGHGDCGRVWRSCRTKHEKCEARGLATNEEGATP
jgi:hypothetical protein